MKVAVIGNIGMSWDGSLSDEYNIAQGFKNMRWDAFPIEREDLVNQLDYLADCDLIIIAQWNGYGPHVIQRIKEHCTCPVLYWAFDYQFRMMEDWHLEMAQEADLFLSKEMGHRAFYEERGCNFYWFPADFGPDFLNIPKVIPQEYELVFTGTYVPYEESQFRPALLKELDKHFDLHIFSVTSQAWRDLGFKNVHEGVMDEEMAKVVAGAKVNISCDLFQSEGYWSDRLSQIMACGGCVVNKYVPLQELYFPPSVIHFNTIEQCIEEIRALLSSDQARERLADQNYAWGRFNAGVTPKIHKLIQMLTGKGLICLK